VNWMLCKDLSVPSCLKREAEDATSVPVYTLVNETAICPDGSPVNFQKRVPATVLSQPWLAIPCNQTVYGYPVPALPCCSLPGDGKTW
jgi:hypothetical protein